MKVRLCDIKDSLRVAIVGDESWLSEIYGAFPVPLGKESPRLTGSIVLQAIPEEYVRVRGRVSYAPWVPCSRCNDAVQWPIEANIDVMYQPEPSHVVQKSKHSLSRAELDEYYFEADGLNLEVLINDTVHLAIPDQVVPCSEDGSCCRVCGKDLSDDVVYGTKEDLRQNPFADLLNSKKK